MRASGVAEMAKLVIVVSIVRAPRFWMYYSAVIAGGVVLGQVLGGLLVDADLFGTGWRPIFFINVPIGLVLLVVGSWPR